MGRSNSSNNNSLISSGESGVVSSSSSSSTYLPNFPPVSSSSQHHIPHYAQSHHPHHPHYQLPPSPPIHPQQYINMGHLAAQQFYEVANNNSHCGGGVTPPISGNNVTPPARVYSPLSHGSNSSGSSLSYVSSGSGGGGVSGVMGPSGNNFTIMEAMNAATVGGGVPSVKCEYEDFPHEPDGGPVKITTWKDHVAVFNMDQVGVMCDVLLQEGDIPRLVDLLATVAKDFSGRSEKILRAQAHVAYHAALEDPRKFPQVYKILETNSFSPQYHAGLQKLWFNAHYKEAEITRGRPLGAVDKYRIRRKFQLPRTIWDGEETVYCFKERSRNSLRQSFALEKYPNLEEKKKLSKETGLTMTQVGNWFKNKRQREKEKMQGKQGAKRKSAYSTPAALAAAMTPDLLGMMLNSSGVNQAHLHPHHHPSAAHHHQSHIAPLSPEDLENAIRKARYEEARLKTYIDETIYSQPPAPAAVPLSPSNLQSYLHHHHHHHNNGPVNNNVPSRSSSLSQQQHPHTQHNMGLPGKSDITIGIVGSPGGSTATPSANNHHHQESSPRSNNGGSGGLTITAVPSPHNDTNNQSNSSPHQNEQSTAGNNLNSSPPQNNSGGGGDLYGGSSSQRPRSTSTSPSLGRCGPDLVPYLHSAAHHHHHPHQHNPYHHHHGHHHTGYDTGVGPLIHPGAAAALSHA